MSDEERRTALRCIGLMRIRAKNELENCRHTMLKYGKDLEMVVNGFLDILNDLDKMEKDIKQ